MIKFTLLSIDAWADPDGGWYWNQWFTVEEGIYLEEAHQTPRYIFAALRRWGYLSEESKGCVSLEDDGHNLVVLNRATREPLFALDYGSNWEFNERGTAA